MNKIIGVTDLQRKFKKAFDEVAEEHVPYILTRGSRPEAALIPWLIRAPSKAGPAAVEQVKSLSRDPSITSPLVPISMASLIFSLSFYSYLIHI